MLALHYHSVRMADHSPVRLVVHLVPKFVGDAPQTPVPGQLTVLVSGDHIQPSLFTCHRRSQPPSGEHRPRSLLNGFPAQHSLRAECTRAPGESVTSFTQPFSISPVLSVVDDTCYTLQPVCVVPVHEILTMVISGAEEHPQACIAHCRNCPNA